MVLCITQNVTWYILEYVTSIHTYIHLWNLDKVLKYKVNHVWRIQYTHNNLKYITDYNVITYILVLLFVK
jgi:hypothetical protein